MRFFLLAACATISLSAVTKNPNLDELVADEDPKKEHIGPWFTGPLLAPSANTVPLGHYNFEPYLFVNNNIGYFSNHWHLHKAYEPNANINFQFVGQMGLTPWMDLTIVPQFFYNYEGEKSSWRFGDLYMGFGFQLLKEEPHNWFPSIKFGFSEVFPTGLYQNLRADKLGTDASGGGTFGTTFKFVFSRLWNVYGNHYLAGRLSTAYIVFSQVSVNGINAYGGDATTKGRVVPGSAFPMILGLEYSLTQHWALALDVASTYTMGTHFKGRTIAKVGHRDWSYSLSFAPAIEFNYNANVGLIAGVWLTGFGANTTDFINGVIALNWYV